MGVFMGRCWGAGHCWGGFGGVSGYAGVRVFFGRSGVAVFEVVGGWCPFQRTASMFSVVMAAAIQVTGLLRWTRVATSLLRLWTKRNSQSASLRSGMFRRSVLNRWEYWVT